VPADVSLGSAAQKPRDRVKDAPSGAAKSARLAWLDALRGIAALFVVFDHLSNYVLRPVRYEVYQILDPGFYGVCVFFLVSGYIVPASLERKGSIRTFWLSRVFRLFRCSWWPSWLCSCCTGSGWSACAAPTSSRSARCSPIYS
jgi:peptidoglycan/LPS O-acetylase OafA/YrhL